MFARSHLKIGPSVGFGPACIANGRLTLSSGQSIVTVDQLAKTTLYYTPFQGAEIGLYIGGEWSIRRFAELSASLAGLAANTNFDVFVYDNAGAPSLELVAWTSDTSRATGIVLQDGLLVKTGDTGKRYVGTIRTTATIGQCEQSFGSVGAPGAEAKQFIWNYYHRRQWRAFMGESTDSWPYTSLAWRYANNNPQMRASFVVGVKEDNFDAVYACSLTGSVICGIGYDANDAFRGQTAMGANANAATVAARAVVAPTSGLHYFAALEFGGATGVYFGDAGLPDRSQYGLTVTGWS